MPQHITVVEYDPQWEELFKKERILIKNILGENAIEIYHIGSTAVKGLCAKPIIDIMPAVKNIAETDLAASRFENIGYEYLGEFGIKGRRYLRKGGDERTHQIHIFQANDTFNIERHLAVRDYLRTHAADASKYGEMKKRLALKYPYDIERYCDGKEQFVKELEIKALLWYKNSF
ncbi:MAG: GrpB family protein [Clostridia bacterium]|nr:GrpB family protein [Clostridia bacterium]